MKGANLMNESLKQMVENLEGENVILDLVGNDEMTLFFKELHIYTDNRNYIIFKDEKDENEFKYAFPIESIMCTEEEYGEWLIVRNTGTDIKVSINN